MGPHRLLTKSTSALSEENSKTINASFVSFFGIIVRMWHDDHPPLHIHVEYQGFEALVQIDAGPIPKDKLQKKVASIISEWCKTHQSELLENWNRAQRFETLERIQGSDRD